MNLILLDLSSSKTLHPLAHSPVHFQFIYPSISARTRRIFIFRDPSDANSIFLFPSCAFFGSAHPIHHDPSCLSQKRRAGKNKRYFRLCVSYTSSYNYNQFFFRPCLLLPELGSQRRHTIFNCPNNAVPTPRGRSKGQRCSELSVYPCAPGLVLSSQRCERPPCGRFAPPSCSHILGSLRHQSAACKMPRDTQRQNI